MYAVSFVGSLNLTAILTTLTKSWKTDLDQDGHDQDRYDESYVQQAC